MKRTVPILVQTGFVGALFLAGAAGCERVVEPAGDPSTARVEKPLSDPKGPAADPSTARVEDLFSARKGFVTKLKVRGPAPQPYKNETPPAGVKEVEYPSGDLKLKGWLSEDAGDAKKRPAVVFLHGGWSFAPVCWSDAEPFQKAGFVLFMPRLRAENGNPGIHESFLGEVDDAIAAGEFVKSLPNVDPENLFVAGHSIGGVLTCLATMLPSPYKAAAALDGHVAMESWVGYFPDQTPYDTDAAEEIRVRNPMAFASSIRCPLRLYVGDDAMGVNMPFAAKAKKAGRDCELVFVGGDHQAMVAPAVERTITWFQQLAVK
jgi:dienelactone hydrolase